MDNQAIKKLEADLWESADLLRQGSNLTSQQYCMPVLGLLFLRYAYSRFQESGSGDSEGPACPQRSRDAGRTLRFCREERAVSPAAGAVFLAGESAGQHPGGTPDHRSGPAPQQSGRSGQSRDGAGGSPVHPMNRRASQGLHDLLR